MAATVTGTAPFATARVALDATGGDVVATTLPSWVRRFKIRIFANDTTTAEAGKVAFTGTDGAAQIAGAYPVPSGVEGEFSLRPTGAAHAAQVVYISGTTNSAYAYLLMEG